MQQTKIHTYYTGGHTLTAHACLMLNNNNLKKKRIKKFKFNSAPYNNMNKSQDNINVSYNYTKDYTALGGRQLKNKQNRKIKQYNSNANSENISISPSQIILCSVHSVRSMHLIVVYDTA